jgi:Lon-like protease
MVTPQEGGAFPAPGVRPAPVNGGRRITPKRVAVALGLVVAAFALVTWLYPSGDYLLIPNQAQPLADRVTVPGEKERTGDDGIYFVDVTIRPATLLEKILAVVRPEGASLVAEADVVAAGSTFEEERITAQEEMNRSERIASAVALRAAGYAVKTRARGVLVHGVFSDVPARKDLKEGDVVVGIGGHPVQTLAQLRAEMGKVKPGEAVVLSLRRKKQTVDTTVMTVHDPREPSRAVIGFLPTQDAQIELPVKIDIDLGEVGGPSAGLPFALDVLAELGTDLAPGYRVGATGEIEIDGSVRPVGGIKQKTYGVRAAKADVFLVPVGDNADEARRYAGNLKVIPVENFQQALRALRTLPAK